MTITNITYSGLSAGGVFNISNSGSNNLSIGNTNFTSSKDMVITGDIIFQGSPLSERLERIEKAISFYHVLEERYPRLKEISQQYQAELEKYITWESISK